MPLISNAQSSIQFHQIGINDRLTDLTVNSIAQDSLGILYFGTENGLSIYDGRSFENYYADQDSNTITDNEIFDIMVDRSNRIWIATGTGIDRYNRETAKFKSYKINSTNYTISTIFQDSYDVIWICTWGAGLCYFDEDSDSIISLSDTLIRYASISSIAEDLRGNIWLGSENEGLFYMDRNTLKVFSFNNIIEGICSPYYLNNTRIRAICPDQSGNMLIGTYDSGLYKYNASLKKISRLTTESELLNSKSRISGILKDDNNKFWISTDGDGVFLYNLQNNTVRDVNSDYNFNNPIFSKAIRTIFFDNNKTLWLGTYKAGVNFTYDVQRNRFEHFHHDFSKKSIISIEGIDNSMVLIGTDGAGLYIFDESLKKLRSINISKSNFTEISLCIHKDFENNFWVGSFTEGVIEFDSNLSLIRHLSKKTETYSHNDIRSIVSDSNYVYIATNYHGLDIYDRNTQTISNYSNNFTYPDSGITFNLLKPLLLDSHGYLWIGSKNGITRFNPVTKEYVNIYSTSEDGQPTSVNSIFEDNQGYIWLGTNNGLSKLNSSIWAEEINNKDSIYNRSNYTFTNYELNKKQGSIIVYSILEDQQGNLWLGTNNGLIRFNMKEEYAKFFYSEAGVNMKLFNPRSAYKSNNGYMYFGGNYGFIRFYPDSITDINMESHIIISSFSINMKEYSNGDLFNSEVVLNKHINFTNELKIKHGAKIVSIGYGSTNSFLPHEIEYAYMLSKFDDDWNYTNSEHRTATYTNLEPGTYTFKLKAKYSNEEWNNNIKELQITILPPFWKTWWFKIIISLLSISLLYLIYVKRIINLKNLNLRLEENVTLKTTELLKEMEAKLVKLENNKKLLLEKQEIANERLQYEQEMQVALNEKLVAEIELKNQLENNMKGEMSASLAQISKMNDLLQTLKNKLIAIPPIENEETQSKLNRVISKIDSESFFQDDWQKFEKHFNSVYADFIQQLKQRFPKLTRKELRLCSYLKMNLSGNEIAQLSNITVRGVEKSRSRLRKKINLTAEDDLNSFIINL